MRMLVKVKIPHEKFNVAVRDGNVDKTMQKIFESTNPEAIYFTEMDGERGVILIVDVADPSQVPVIAEPWFLQFDAKVTFHIVMSREDLQKAGLEGIGKKWA